MSNSTPGSVDPYKLAKYSQSLEGTLDVAAMTRANKLLVSELGTVSYSLKFSMDTESFCCIEGELDCILTMRCQRCLREYAQPVTSSFRVSPVKSDADAKLLPGEYEPVIIVDGKLYPAELVEDELILALPIVPLHPYGSADCIEIVETQVDSKAQVLSNPFQVLQTLDVNKKGQQAEDK